MCRPFGGLYSENVLESVLCCFSCLVSDLGQEMILAKSVTDEMIFMLVEGEEIISDLFPGVTGDISV